MFAYCNNNPINAVDPSGHALVYVSVGFYDDPTRYMFFGGGGGGGGGGCAYALSAFSAVLKIIENDAPKHEDTTSHGITFSGAFGAAVAVIFGYTYDDNDNFGFYATVSIGAGTPSAGISGSVTKTNAPTIYDQRGWGLSMGGSVSPAIPFLSVGGDYNMLLDDTFSPAYSGFTTNVGVGVGLPAEWHGTFDYTWVWGWNKRNL